VESSEAIRQAVLDHLRGRAGLNLNSMDVEIASVQFRGQQADARVRFRAKNSNDPAASLEMVYTLERSGRGWRVTSRSGVDATHPGGMASPHGQAGPVEGTLLPPGHPPVGSQPNNPRP